MNTFRWSQIVLNSRSGCLSYTRPTCEESGRGGHRAHPVQSRGNCKALIHPTPRKKRTSGIESGFAAGVGGWNRPDQTLTRLGALSYARSLPASRLRLGPARLSPCPGAKRQVCGAASLAALRQGGRCGLRPRSGPSRRLWPPTPAAPGRNSPLTPFRPAPPRSGPPLAGLRSPSGTVAA